MSHITNELYYVFFLIEDSSMKNGLPYLTESSLIHYFYHLTFPVLVSSVPNLQFLGLKIVIKILYYKKSLSSFEEFAKNHII